MRLDERRMSAKERAVSQLSVESVKMMAESVGVTALPEDTCREISEDATYRLRVIIQEAIKFTRHGKRKRMTSFDLDNALRVKNVEPLYGFTDPHFIPFRFASGGGRELYFHEDKELDLGELVSGSLPKLPLDISLKTHWLSIEGIQPTIADNPPPVPKDQQRQESLDPLSKLCKPQQAERTAKHVETVRVKQLATHELSVEQQLYYKEITEACVGSDDSRRAEALQSLSSDPGLHQMLPRLCTFISEGVKVNVVQYNLAFLIYLIRMVKALLDNQSLYLEKYLHEIIPSVTTCIVSRQLCTRPEVDNHWALRDFASRLLAQICKNFNTSTNGIQVRVTKAFSKALMNDRMPLASIYGAVSVLGELGTEVVRSLLIPRVREISDRLRRCLEEPGVVSSEKKAAEQAKQILVRVVAPVLKATRSPPDNHEQFRSEFGYLGPFLIAQVTRLRTQAAAASSGAGGGRPPVTVAHTTRVVQQATPLSGSSAGTNSLSVAPAARSTSTLVTNNSIGQATSSGQKFLITQRAQTVSQQSTSTSQQIVRVVGTPSGTAVKTAVGVASGPATKVVVMGQKQVQYVMAAQGNQNAGSPAARSANSRPDTPDVQPEQQHDIKYEPH
ncbi:transcription initiation factor TFIID subunit 6-like isoform X2 [Varroa jacobsoni]|nr:transcription initiation factor TFIID subunit 6-like isoform X4 [Varroa destructor]XP_022669223.1 transcription initiation factor TFIID subunit 6-like isoform X4 [Varroa destructor]XP_022669224.1 transcription initiation factor TFIID subunit 6-like isoform X4 [Varroa destructor]XP_022694428.1 transcription initiation factor TFIID subunit 6-like isoform X2 [Varroa jacobsoni]XP_022694429.1 transcription initiation factor TFIID subunit 6-like isoform X2 [Varroa jacobsoni]